ncbi:MULTISPECIES: Na/Pi cotransporter family protein [Neorhizobium]|uniref:Na/Pi cotransporter family protein n=1 Tax=Neorhizobium TaxID=1525371 RepID=UPI0006224981|nr:Na/Pi symporter [Neorhizobium galegae]CDZ58492.1 Na+/Pi-cotransporter family protein [Neorhizobium galegae bv. orientalis]KAB1121539.1 Na/Pi cotransporter family protein [Neorhizobium galegae]MCQ1570444.1 Na/Pi symporter [Neorhizobium galegae]MCQ1809320.1 Na/Pi symporter [Neorhizobium galegae]CDZ63737.1 Na+/Pi-cotransporter family protein [Neorhizobium galegae bv. orientalis]
MNIDIFKDILVPVIGGLGIFMLGLEFMSNGIQALSVNKMRAFLAKAAGTPIKGVIAGTVITGVIQSSTAMTVMVVGLVNAGVVGLRPAISVIMGANIGTTLGNGLIALPLGPLGLIFAGTFSLVYCFAKSEKVRNIALACMGFALIFYGLNLMTGGLRPLRNIPEVMAVLSTLTADSYYNLIKCVLIAAGVTAMIHSSSATIGIVMGLGAAGVLDWTTAVAFSLGADLGTTITSWIASLNLSKNAKRAAYAHMSFNIIGVCITVPLFFVSIDVLAWAMQWFGGDPGVAVVIEGKETFPLVPVAVGLYSTFFNVFNTALLFPFVGVFDRVLSRIGRTDAEDAEDYSTPKFLDRKLAGNFALAVPAVQKETARHLQAGAMFLDIARSAKSAPSDPGEHYLATDILSRDIRDYTASLMKEDLPYEQLDLVASLIEEADFTAALTESMHQVARRVRREKFSSQAQAIVDVALNKLGTALQEIMPDHGVTRPDMPAGHVSLPEVEELRARTLALGPNAGAAERGTILALLGSIERAQILIHRIDAERKSVNRQSILSRVPRQRDEQARPVSNEGGFSPMPAE